MRWLSSLFFVLALGLMGCSETSGTGGSGGSGGNGVACQGNVCPCTEAGIRAAIAEGGGPFTFACGGLRTVVTEAEIVIDNDVILDGLGWLTLDGNDEHRVFLVAEGATVELHGFTVTRGRVEGDGGGIANDYGTLTINTSTVSGNTSMCNAGGISNTGTLTLINSTVSGNTDEGKAPSKEQPCLGGGGVGNYLGTLMMTNCTVSGNIYGGISNIMGTATVVSSTVSDNTVFDIRSIFEAVSTFTNSVVDGDCDADIVSILSNGYNIESPGNTCGFDQPTDQVSVSAEALALGPLADNGGPTMTQALGAGSVAVDLIPVEDCLDSDGEPLTTDQRSERRDSMCDVGAFEWSARDAALASYCAAVLECFPDDESCEADFVNLLWVGSGGDFAACTSAKSELVECAASLDCDKLGEGSQAVLEECGVQLVAAWQTCEVPVK